MTRPFEIEVGYGLEAILPDGLAGEIIRTEIISLGVPVAIAVVAAAALQ